MNCPACMEQPMAERTQFPFGDFDGGLFNYSASVLECPACGFVRNRGEFDDQTISQHYSEQCLYSSQSGVGIGGCSAEDNIRYEHYVSVLQKHGLTAGELVDVGCSRGGFLKHLHSRAPEQYALSGVDLDSSSLATSEASVEFLHGNAFDLPFRDGTKDAVCYFHVLEHLLDIDAAFAECYRVLSSTGRAFIEVPDATLYDLSRVGTLFWMGMKEHTNHFSLPALLKLGKRHGLELVGFERSLLPMKGDVSYPSLIAVFSKSTTAPLPVNSVEQVNFGRNIISHLRQEQKYFAAEKANLLNATRHQKTTFWGIGLEFLNLYAHGLLNEINTVQLIDANQSKQQLKVAGHPIIAPASAIPTDRLIICSYLSEKSIFNAAIKYGWTESQIFRLV